MGLTVEDRYLPLPTLTTLKVLYLPKKKIHKHTASYCMSYNISLTSINRITKYDLQLKCMLVCCMHPLPGSHLIVLLLSVFFIRVFTPINVSSFLRKHLTQACSSIIFALSQLLIKYLSSMAKQICMMPDRGHRHQRIFIHQFSNS